MLVGAWTAYDNGKSKKSAEAALGLGGLQSEKNIMASCAAKEGYKIQEGAGDEIRKRGRFSC